MNVEFQEPPTSVAKLIKLGYEVLVEKGAGQQASFTDEQFENAGATIVPTTSWDSADIILKVRGYPGKEAIRQAKLEGYVDKQ